MLTVLVVDDAGVDREIARSCLESEGIRALTAANGREALALIETAIPDLVLTDLQMPELDGLELVQEINSRFPSIPVILMTSHGSEEIAVTALKSGAASYVPKKNLQRDLGQTLRVVLSVADARRQQQAVVTWMTEMQAEYCLSNDMSAPRLLVGHLKEQLLQVRFCGAAELVRIGTALHEAMLNAIEHGNLELDSELREENFAQYGKLAEERARQSPYRERTVTVRVHMTRDAVRYVITDQGPGFSPSSLPDPRSVTNLERVSGRGLLLINAFMDDVSFNETGNEVTLVKKRSPVPDTDEE